MTPVFLVFLEDGYSLYCIPGRGGEKCCKMQDTHFFCTDFLDTAKLMQASNILPFDPLPSPFLSPCLLTLGFFLGSMWDEFTSQRLWAASGTQTVKALHRLPNVLCVYRLVKLLQRWYF